MNQYLSNFCRITYIPESRQIYMKWLLPPDQATLLSCYRKGLELAKSSRALSWIADNTIGFYVNISMQRALAKLVAGHLCHTSLRKIARVVPPDVLQELVMHKVVDQIQELSETQVQFELFNDPKEAKEWCAQLPPASAS